MRLLILMTLIISFLTITVNGQSTTKPGDGAVSRVASRFTNGGLGIASGVLDAIRSGLSSGGLTKSSDIIDRVKKRIDAASKAGR